MRVFLEIGFNSVLSIREELLVLMNSVYPCTQQDATSDGNTEQPCECGTDCPRRTDLGRSGFSVCLMASGVKSTSKGDQKQQERQKSAKGKFRQGIAFAQMEKDSQKG